MVAERHQNRLQGGQGVHGIIDSIERGIVFQQKFTFVEV
jgi:hypothetical protein